MSKEKPPEETSFDFNGQDGEKYSFNIARRKGLIRRGSCEQCGAFTEVGVPVFGKNYCPKCYTENKPWDKENEEN